MSIPPKIPTLSPVFEQQSGRSGQGSFNKDNTQWNSQLKTPNSQNMQSSIKTMRIPLESAPKNITNQNGLLSPQQMAQHLSRELAKRAGKRGGVGKKGLHTPVGFESDLSSILDEDEGLASLLNANDPEAIAEFLAFFQSEMSRHLQGMEFGNITYDPELLNMIRHWL